MRRSGNLTDGEANRPPPFFPYGIVHLPRLQSVINTLEYASGFEFDVIYAYNSSVENENRTRSLNPWIIFLLPLLCLIFVRCFFVRF
jgi:hypothetical protein